MSATDLQQDAAPLPARRPPGKHVWGADAPPAPFDLLTRTQLEVARALARGETSPAIARRLACSRKTIDTHRGALLRRLSLASTVHLARLAIRVGLVTAGAEEDF